MAIYIKKAIYIKMAVSSLNIFGYHWLINVTDDNTMNKKLSAEFQ